MIDFEEIKNKRRTERLIDLLDFKWVKMNYNEQNKIIKVYFTDKFNVKFPLLEYEKSNSELMSLADDISKKILEVYRNEI